MFLEENWTEYKGQIWLSSFIRVLKKKNRTNKIYIDIHRWFIIEIDSHSYGDQELSCQPSPNLTSRKSGAIFQSESNNLRIRGIWIETQRTRSVNIWGLEKIDARARVCVCVSVWIILWPSMFRLYPLH